MSIKVLVLYYSQSGSVQKMAEEIATGVESVKGVEAMIRTVPRVTSTIDGNEPSIPDNGPLYCTDEDLVECDGILIGSPTRFGNMAAPMKYFIDGLSHLWLTGKLADKPFGVFTSTSTMHGGQESTLLSMALPFIHQGMVYCGIPYTEPALHLTQSGGSPYGSTHVDHPKDAPLTEHERELCHAQGKRIAQMSIKLSNSDQP